ncbi:MAG: 50S ribosomal protein L32 [Holosporales bacterium]|jgi:large subunit ribosomal protein L32|nr:50S ribosomal protein L32 [Holosporales bacterium]
MAVPKKRTSHSRRNMRRAHDRLTARNPVPCPNCGAHKLSHHVCGTCGHYRGRLVITQKETSSQSGS